MTFAPSNSSRRAPPRGRRRPRGRPPAGRPAHSCRCGLAGRRPRVAAPSAPPRPRGSPEVSRHTAATVRSPAPPHPPALAPFDASRAASALGLAASRALTGQVGSPPPFGAWRGKPVRVRGRFEASVVSSSAAGSRSHEPGSGLPVERRVEVVRLEVRVLREDLVDRAPPSQQADDHADRHAKAPAAGLAAYAGETVPMEVQLCRAGRVAPASAGEARVRLGSARGGPRLGLGWLGSLCRALSSDTNF